MVKTELEEMFGEVRSSGFIVLSYCSSFHKKLSVAQQVIGLTIADRQRVKKFIEPGKGRSEMDPMRG
jgi:hypothetical protein